MVAGARGIAALQLLPVLAVAVGVMGIAITIESGTWMVGVPELVGSELGHGAGGFSLVKVGYALGSIAGDLRLARRPVSRKAYASLVAWTLYVPAYLLMALAGTLAVAVRGALCAGVGQGSSIVLLHSAAQEHVPDRVLGRVMGLINLVHRGAHATGLMFVSPLFAFPPRPIFVGAALAAPLVGIGGALVALALSPRGGEARARGASRSLRS